jgi:dolichol-phosphate mannosyltransferase
MIIERGAPAITMRLRNKIPLPGIATALPPLADLAMFCVLFGSAMPPGSSQIASFAVAMALNYLLKVRSTLAASGHGRDARLHIRLVAVCGMALFLRAGVLGLAVLVWGWPAQTAIVAAIVAGMAVTAPGYAAVLSPAAGEDRVRAAALGLVLYAVVLRLVYLGSVELLPEETYYWNYAQHLDIGYLDHPPMVAWLIRLGTAVFGQTQFGVRAAALGCGLIASFFTYRLTRNLFGDSAALAALVLAQVLPFFFLSGLLMTPDAPLTAAWAAALYFLERALVAERSAAWWGVGIALGVGAISKYSIGLLVPVTFAFMLWDARARRWWLRWQPYAAGLIALAIFSPVIIWNAEHDWASFAFQTSRRLAEAPRFALHKLIASALVLITPTGLLAVLAAFISTNAWDEGNGAPRRRLFIRLAVLIPLAVFALFSLRHEVKLDWTGAPWTAALPVMAAGMLAGKMALTRLGAWVRSAWTPTLLILLLIYGAGLQYLVLGLPGLGYGKHIELVPVAWRDLARQVTDTAAAVRKDTGSDVLIVGMDRYAIASELAFYGAERTGSAVETSSAHLFGGLGLMYERWTPAPLQEGRTLLLVAWEASELTGGAVEGHADRLGPVESRTLTRDGHMVRHYYQRLAYNYRHDAPATAR